MATTDKKTAETKKATTPKPRAKTAPAPAPAPVADNSENLALKAQIAEQQAAMNKMQAQMEAMMKMFGNGTAKPEAPKKSNRMIRFVNLKNATVILKGTSFWEIDGRYNYKDFPEQEARAIVLNMANFLRKGTVYIDDAEFVRDNDLEVAYETLLSDHDLRTLLDKSSADVVEIYKNVNDSQKEVIIDAVIDDRRAGKEIDYNILATLSGLCGKDLINLDNDDED